MQVDEPGRCGVNRHHIHRLLEDVGDVAAWGQLAGLVDPSLLRREAESDQVLGLRQVLGHTLRGTILTRASDRMLQGELLPTSLTTSDGARIGVLTTYLDGHYSRHDFDDFVTSQEFPEIDDTGRLLPWERTVPKFDRSAPVDVRFHRHLLDHPDRFGSSPLEDARRRLPVALRCMRWRLQHCDTKIGAYWYEGNPAGWAYVAPLVVTGGPLLAAVLSRKGVGDSNGYCVPTVLSAHDAFWNIVSTGQVPPTWLDGPGKARRLAA